MDLLDFPGPNWREWQKPALIIVDADFLAEQFHHYKEIFSTTQAQFHLDMIKEEGIPEKVDPFFLRKALCERVRAVEEESVFLMLYRRQVPDIFSSDPSEAFRVIRCSRSIRKQMVAAIEEHSELPHFLALGKLSDQAHLAQLELHWNFSLSSFITSYEEDQRLEGVFFAVLWTKALRSGNPKDYFHGSEDRGYELGGYDECTSEIAWVMGFTKYCVPFPFRNDWWKDEYLKWCLKKATRKLRSLYAIPR